MSTLTIYGFGKRGTVKVATPNTTLAEIRDLFCQKFGVSVSPTPPSFCRPGEKRPLDMSISFRLSGLSSGQTVEIIRSSAPPCSSFVAVAIQLPDGSRVRIDNAPASSSLWSLIESAGERAGRSLAMSEDPKSHTFMQPVVVFLQREVASNDDLHKFTLSSLGVSSGSALLRLSFRQTSIPFQVVADSEKQRKEKLEAAAASKKAETPPIDQVAKPAAPPAEKMEVVPPSVAQESVQASPVSPKKIETHPIEQTTKPAPAAEPMEVILPSNAHVLDEEERRERLAALVAEESRRAAITEAEIAAERERTRVEKAQREEFERRAREKEERLLAQWELDDAAVLRAREQQQFVDTQPPPPPQPQPPVAAADVEQVAPADVPESEREVSVFPPSDVAFDPSSIAIPDEFYDLTAEDLASIRASERRAKAESQVLMTKEMRDRLRGNVWHKFKRCTIRVRFPDRIEIQRTFVPGSPVSLVEQFVRDSLANPEAEFILFTTPPVQPLGDGSATLLKRQLVPAALVHLKWKDPSRVSHPFIKPELMQKVSQKLPPNWTYVVPTTTTAAATAATQRRCANCLAASTRLADCEECGNGFCPECWTSVHQGELSQHHRVSSSPAPSSSSSKQNKSDFVPKWFNKGKKF